MQLNEFAKEVHENAVAHGWWESPRDFPEVAALIHSEISEALEEYREGNPVIWRRCNPTDIFAGCNHMKGVNINGGRALSCIKPDGDCRYCERKPEGVAVELCDAIIRILDYLAYMGVDVEAVLMAKHEYNKGREYRHGGKRA